MNWIDRPFCSPFVATDYRRPMKLFLIKIPQTIGQIHFGLHIWSIFGQFISTHFCTVSPCFSLINNYFYKKLSLYILYIQIPNIYLGLGFDFGPQRLRNLAMRSVSIVRGHDQLKKSNVEQLCFYWNSMVIYSDPYCQIKFAWRNTIPRV